MTTSARRTAIHNLLAATYGGRPIVLPDSGATTHAARLAGRPD